MNPLYLEGLVGFDLIGVMVAVAVIGGFWLAYQELM